MPLTIADAQRRVQQATQEIPPANAAKQSSQSHASRGDVCDMYIPKTSFLGKMFHMGVHVCCPRNALLPNTVRESNAPPNRARLVEMLGSEFYKPRSGVSPTACSDIANLGIGKPGQEKTGDEKALQTFVDKKPSSR